MDVNLYAEGSIYFYENKTNTKEDYSNPDINHDFIVSRPVYVLRSTPVPFQTFTINVLEITSSMDRVGIPIVLEENRNSKILPYASFSLHPEYLTRYMGKAPESVVQEVRIAKAYHDGYSEKKPQYLIDYEEKTVSLVKTYMAMTLREKILYQFVKKMCVISKNAFITQTELILAYNEFGGKYSYDRTTDFTKGLSKILAFFPGATRSRENGEYIYFGIGLKGNIHDITNPCHLETPVEFPEKTTVRKKKKKKKQDVHCDKNEVFLMKLGKDAMATFLRMDLIEKIQNWHSTLRESEYPKCTRKELQLISHIIDNEMDQLKEKIFRMLDNGENPLNIPHSHQFLLYKCSNNDIRNHVIAKHIKKLGGISKLRRCLRNNVKHYFPKI